MEKLYYKYAELLLKRCLNITKSQPLFISKPSGDIQILPKIVEIANQLGIDDIYIETRDSFVQHDILKHINVEHIKHCDAFNSEIWDEYAKKNAAFLYLDTEYPGLMDDIETAKLTEAELNIRKTKPIYKEKQLSYKIPWCIAAVPSVMWAEKLFPNDVNAYQKLWNTIFDMCLINKKKPILEWNKKVELSNEKCSLLNSLQLKQLHYDNNLGTDLTIGLPNNHVWYGAGKKDDNNRNIIVNMPTEEAYTSPNRTEINGVVYSSRPLIYNGAYIDEFRLEFKDGKVVDVTATNGKETLKKILETDEGSSYLGEVALVDYNSPISKSNIIFYTTLFDENASCHLALGSSFPKCLKNSEKMNNLEYLKAGLNKSNIHVDFMIGTKDLLISGKTNNDEEVQVFQNGNFSIDKEKVLYYKKRK